MKTFAIARNSNEVPVKELAPAPKPVPVAKEVTPVEMQPTFTLTFALGTRMRELHDTIIRTVLQYTRGNRLRAAQLLQINPRTIRRRLGKKEAADSVTRAA
jgi:DNA-binding NtrC family response regulator